MPVFANDAQYLLKMVWQRSGAGSPAGQAVGEGSFHGPSFYSLTEMTQVLFHFSRIRRSISGCGLILLSGLFKRILDHLLDHRYVAGVSGEVLCCDAAGSFQVDGGKVRHILLLGCFTV
jgi:hypothetical protein